MKIKLYSNAYQDRSDRVRWLLEEMGVAYDDKILSSSELKAPEYLKLNPMGRRPTIVDGDIILFESVAICAYLADRYSYGVLAPKMEDTKLRAEYLQWMGFSVGSLEAVVARMFTHVSHPEEEAVTLKYVSEQSEIFKKVLNPVLAKQEYILSAGFSAADIMLASIIPGAHDFLVKDNPPIESYMKRMMSREAAIRAKVF
jgi:glutathione S-transferase